MRIAVVGGSIAGCALAACLRDDERFDVQVFERSSAELRDRGAGIVAPMPVIQALRTRDLIDRDMALLETPGIRNSARRGDEPTGHMAWEAPVQVARLRWNDLYSNLRKRVPADCFQLGRTITRATQHAENRVMLEFEEASPEYFDLAVFADGYRSQGRRILFPEARLEYQGYCGLRGTLRESNIDPVGPLEDSLYRISYSQGHVVFYLVAGEQGDTRPGHRLLNWGAYIQVPPQELSEFITDAQGRSHFGSVPFGQMRPAQINALRQVLAKELPPYFGNLACHDATDYALQAMFACELPGYRRGRLALAGDAGMIAPPFTGSGVFKGITNATALADALTQTVSTEQALDEWDRSQTEVGRAQIALGKRLENALIWQIPDFARQSEQQMIDWWENAAKFPDDVWQQEDDGDES